MATAERLADDSVRVTLLPRIELVGNAFEARHRVIRLILWLHVLLVVGVSSITTWAGWLTGHQSESTATAAMAPGAGVSLVDSHVVVTWSFVVGAVVCAAVSPLARSRRGQALWVSLGLLMCANALVHGSGGQTDMHFDYFVVLALISLYQDWIVFAVGVLMVAVHHAVMGAFAPSMVFSSPQAQANPLAYAALHAIFVVAMSAAQLTYWHFTQKADLALRRSTAEANRLALVARYTDNAVVITDADGVIGWVNDAFTHMTDYTFDEAVGRPRLDLFHGSDDEIAALQKLFADPSQAVDAEFLTRTRHGHPYWINIEVRPIVEDGRLTRLIGVERDVSARRASEERRLTASRRAAALAEALSAEKSLLSGVISAIPHLVYWKDADGRFSGGNKAFYHWNEQGVSALRLLAAVLDPLENEVRQSRLAVVDRQVNVPRPDGTVASMLVSVLPNPGTPDGLIGVGADITHITTLEKQLAQAHRLEAVGQLAAGIAHEINTPVQFVSDNTRFVADSFRSLLPTMRAIQALGGPGGTADPAPDAVGELRAALGSVDLDFLSQEVPTALEESLEGLSRVAQIVRAMKDFSHPGQVSAPADLNRAVESTVQVCRNEWKYLATLDLDLDPDLGLVECHEGEIKQVVLNMVVNAAHAIEERRRADGTEALGEIRVTTRRVDAVVRITIGDDGLGMDQQTLQRIFDPFFTTKQVGKGTGQGLSLAHSTVVTKHGGEISVQSAPGAGTTFTITLPVTGPPAAPAAPLPPR